MRRPQSSQGDARLDDRRLANQVSTDQDQETAHGKFASNETPSAKTAGVAPVSERREHGSP